METHHYTLQKYSGITSRYTCPACGKHRVFSRYVSCDNEQLAEHVGRCNREVECGYHYKPSDFFRDTPGISRPKPQTSQVLTAKTVDTSYISNIFFDASRNPIHFEQNHFVQYLKSIVGDKWHDVANRFLIGTANHWPGSVVFWQVDKRGKIRSGKIMDYNPETGKRVKNRITWVHSELQKKGLINGFNLKQCLFGEHQLAAEPLRPIGIVESEKTAIIASAYMPELQWMACGSLNGISSDRFNAIKENNIVLYPDINGFDKWNIKANELRQNGFRITVSGILEKSDFVSDQDRSNGFDLADYLPRLPVPVSPLERLVIRNPLLKELIKRFDLVETV